MLLILTPAESLMVTSQTIQGILRGAFYAILLINGDRNAGYEVS